MLQGFPPLGQQREAALAQAPLPLRSAYRPLNTGGRFSANARWPSW